MNAVRHLAWPTIFTACVLLGVLGSAHAQTTYWVNALHIAASDTNFGTSQNAPWKTITKATITVLDNDTVMIKKGNYTKLGNLEAFPLQIKSTGARFVGAEASQADWPRLGGDIADSAIKGVFEVNASAVTGDMQLVTLEKLVFVGENTAGKDAPSAVYVSVEDERIVDVSVQNCILERSYMNDAGVAEDRPSVLAIGGAGNCSVTVDNCKVAPNVSGGIKMDAGLDVGVGASRVSRTLS